MTDAADPRREKLRRDKELPSAMKSKTLNEEPRRLMPYTDNALPRRTKLRSESELPSAMKSNTEKELPNLDMP